MTLARYLEIIYSVFANFYEKIDYYYKEAVFISDGEGNVPLKFTVDNGELKVLVKKTHYNEYGSNTHDYVAQGFYKPLLSNNYMVDGMGVYPLNNDIIKEALEYVERYKELFKNLHERKSFYSGKYRVTIESYDFSTEKDKENRTMEIVLYYGNYESTHLYADIDKRYLETVDNFSLHYLDEIIIPKEVIPDVIKELLMANNFPIEPLKESERIIHEWHAPWQPMLIGLPPRERSKRRWLIY